MRRDLEHSALGSHWTKKNHKYIRKEGNRYIYPEDLQKTRRGGGGPIVREESRGSGRGLGVSNSAEGSGRNLGELKSAKGSGRNLGESKSVKGSERTFDPNPLRKSAREQQILANRAKIVNNQKSPDYKTISKVHAFEQRANKREQEIEENRRKRVRESIDTTNKAQAERSKENRMNSATGRTARDILSKRGVKSVSYQDGRNEYDSKGFKLNENGAPVRVRRSVGTKLGYDDRGFQTKENYKEDSVRQTARTPKSGTARDIIRKKGTQRVSYNEDSTGTLKRTATNRDYSKDTTEIKRSSLEKRKARGRRVIDQYREKKQMEKLQKQYEKQKAKIQKQAAKEREREERKARRELDRQIPLSMRLKRDSKKVKRFFNK